MAELPDKAARRDLRGGREVTSVPTATTSYARRSGARSLCCGRRRAIHVQWIAALRDILAVA